jgi:site-specific recombinase XerD
VYQQVLRKHAKAAGIEGKSFGLHAPRAMAATNALDRGADLGKVQDWLSASQLSPPPGCTTAAPARQAHLPGGVLT